jgi:murein DD-endopeptidase MepM/ murein hydrolase activator NlpD
MASESRATVPASEWGSGWFWPVPDLISHGGARFPAVITQEFKGPPHRGVDIMIATTSIDLGGGGGGGGGHTGQPRVRISGFDPNQMNPDKRTRDVHKLGTWFAPKGTPILAARDARVYSVEPSVNGIFVVLDHGAPWATQYGHLETTTLEKTFRYASKETVRAGDVIGTMGAGLNRDPKKGLVDAEHLRHLHFEAWFKGTSKQAVDPARDMKTWERSTWRTQL